MEWKWVKSFLIIAFVILNCFLIYKLYERNKLIAVNSESISSVQAILSSRGIKCDVDLTNVQTKQYMKKIVISNSKNIEPNFIGVSDLKNENGLYVGRNRRILSLPIIITNLIRDTKIEGEVIQEIALGYYPEMSQIDNTVLSGEAIPAWKIVFSSGKVYIYNAYLGSEMTVK